MFEKNFYSRKSKIQNLEITKSRRDRERTKTLRKQLDGKEEKAKVIGCGDEEQTLKLYIVVQEHTHHTSRKKR